MEKYEGPAEKATTIYILARLRKNGISKEHHMFYERLEIYGRLCGKKRTVITVKEESGECWKCGAGNKIIGRIKTLNAQHDANRRLFPKFHE